MESIARTKSNMSVLPKDILPVTPFAVLSQAFTEEILGRFESEPGMYPMYGLEFLHPEESADETPAGGNVQLEVQLKLILQQMKESGKTTAAERILEKAETLRLLREKTVVRHVPGAAGNMTAHSRSGASPRVALADRKRGNAGSYWPGTHAAPAAGMGYRPMEAHSGAAAGMGYRPTETHSGAAAGIGYRPTETHGGAVAGIGYRPTETHGGAVAGRGYRRPVTYAVAASDGDYRPSGIYATPMASAVNGQPGGRITAEMSPGAKALGAMRTDPEDPQISLREKTLWSQRVQSMPAAPAIQRDGAPTIQGDDALARMGAPAVSGLPGQAGYSRAQVQFLTPQEADASGGQQISREETAAGLTRQMEQAASQAAEAIARAMATEPQGTRAEDHRRYAKQASSNAEQKIQGGVLSQSGQIHREAETDAPGRDSSVRADHAPTGMAADRRAAGTMASDGEMPDAHFSTKEWTDSDRGVGRIGPTARDITRDIRTSGGRQINGLPDTELTTSGAVGSVPALRQDIPSGAEGFAAVPEYLPLSLEHAEMADAPEQQSAPVRSASAEEAGRQLAREIETALGAERTLAQASKDGRRQMHPTAERKSGAHGGDSPARAEAAAAIASQTAGTAAPDGGQPMRRKQSGFAAKGAEETAESTAPSAQRNWTAVAQPAAGRWMADRPTVGPLTPDPLPNYPPAIEHPAANGPGVPRGMADTHFETGSGVTESGYISTELAGQPPLTLEYLQEAQKDDLQAAEQVQALPALEKLLDTPGIRLLSKDIAVLTADRRESRESRENRQAAPRGNHAAQWIAGRAARAGDIAGGIAGNIAGGTPGGGMSPLEAGAQSHAWSQAAQPPVELAHMEPSLEAQAAGPAGQASSRRETGTQQEALLKEIQRSLAGGRPGAARFGQSAFHGQTGAEQRAFDRETAASPTRAGRQGLMVRRPGQLPVAGHMGTLPRGRGSAFGAVPGSSAHGGMDQEAPDAYPALSMEYGGPVAAMARELRQTAARALGQAGAAREMGLHTTPAAKAMEEKSAPENMQTLDLMTQPQIQEQQVVWENPYMRSAPAEMTHHQKNNPQNQQKMPQSQPQLRMSDAEIRRAADKVFKLVQEKIVNERRRIGRM